MVERAGEDSRGLFVRAGIDFSVDSAAEPLWVDGDATRLIQVNGNLLQNAAKFTPRGGRTWLSVERSGTRAVIRVRDTGAGMSGETLRQLFEPFVQASRTLDRSPGGLGLGLALVKGLVELHEGEITATSEGMRKGSEFAIALPLAASAFQGADAAEHPAVAAQNS